MKIPPGCLPGLVLSGFAATLSAQTTATSSTNPLPSRDQEIRELHKELALIADRLARLEAEKDAGPVSPATHLEAANATSAAPQPAAAEATPALTSADAPTLSFFRGTTFGFGVDADWFPRIVPSEWLAVYLTD